MSYLGCSVRLYLQLFVAGIMSYLGCSVRLYLQLFVAGIMSYLRYLFLFCVVFLFLFTSSYLLYVSSFSGLSFLIVPSIFSNVYTFVRMNNSEFKHFKMEDVLRFIGWKKLKTKQLILRLILRYNLSFVAYNLCENNIIDFWYWNLSSLK
jgi:hypothetical protein